MKKLPNFRTWFVQFLLGASLGGFAYCGLLHFMMGFPFRKVLAPCLVLSLVVIASSPFFYWAAGRARGPGNDLRPIFAVTGVIMTAGSLLILRYAHELGLMSAEAARGSSIAALIGGPSCTVLAYYTSRNLILCDGQNGDDPGKKE
jgi:hypothetical protein